MNEELDTICAEMNGYAEIIGVSGTAVAWAVQRHFDNKVVVDPHLQSIRLSRPPKTEKDGDHGTTYLNMALAKAGRRLRLELGDDKSEVVHAGEVPYHGDVALNLGSLIFVLSFSGGTEEQDEDISSHGLTILKERYMTQ